MGFPLFDIGPGEGRIILRGTSTQLASIRSAQLRGDGVRLRVCVGAVGRARGEDCPIVRVQVYAVKAVSAGYFSLSLYIYTLSFLSSPVTRMRQRGARCAYSCVCVFMCVSGRECVGGGPTRAAIAP